MDWFETIEMIMVSWGAGLGGEDGGVGAAFKSSDAYKEPPMCQVLGNGTGPLSRRGSRNGGNKCSLFTMSKLRLTYPSPVLLW